MVTLIQDPVYNAIHAQAKLFAFPALVTTLRTSRSCMVTSPKQFSKHYEAPCESPPTPTGNSYRSGGRLLGRLSAILMHLAMPLGLRIQPAGRVLRELPPSFRIPSLRFPPTQPRIGFLLTDGVRDGPKRKTPEILGWSVTFGEGRLRRLLERNFPRRENALHPQRPNLKHLGFAPY